ncbi:MAG TPA: hypothetical protein DCE41_35385 [Cytophagales bacterium]|nr:hypothetical protein [Cytophagales bacterium]HAA23460.1 hypothetical protein [Cytophagales bacterium]HAP60663.1 hypothetical protein [Cytophagales bacterium]
MIHVKFEKFAPTLGEFREYLSEFYEVIRQNPGRAHIMDGTNGIWLPSEIQIAQGDWIRENQEFLLEHCPYTAFIVSNKLSKIVLMGIFMVQKPKVPYLVVQSLDNAIRGVRERVGLLVN